MSKIIMIFTLILIDKIHDSHEVQKPLQTTMHVLDRVNILKFQIKEQLKQSHRAGPDPSDIETTIVNENQDYDNVNRPITPIHARDPRKQKEFKLAMIRTTPALHDSKALRQTQREKDFESHVVVPMKRKSKKHATKSSITELFYRRAHASNIVNAWLFCIDLLSPYLTGHRVNMTKPKHIHFNDNVVLRLAQLLTEDLTDHSRDDISSILYQISNLQIRFFQWDISAMKLIFNVINPKHTSPGPDSRHSFRNIKYGLKKIFRNWNLSFETDLSALLKQTNVFRPPCMIITRNEGSTKTSKGVRFIKTKPPKKVCTGRGQVLRNDGKACVGTWIEK